MGVNITAWLVIPRMVASITAPADPSAPGRDPSAHIPPDGMADVAPAAEPQWPEADPAVEEPAADEWSSSWDYAGPDGPEGLDGGEDDQWYLPGGNDTADSAAWSIAVGGPRSRPAGWSPDAPSA